MVEPRASVAITGIGVLAWTRDTASPGGAPSGPAVQDSPPFANSAM